MIVEEINIIILKKWVMRTKFCYEFSQYHCFLPNFPYIFGNTVFLFNYLQFSLAALAALATFTISNIAFDAIMYFSRILSTIIYILFVFSFCNNYVSIDVFVIWIENNPNNMHKCDKYKTSFQNVIGLAISGYYC